MAPRLPSLRTPPIAFARRGASAHAPRNSLEAFGLAQRLGATGIHSDVWATADGHAVLHHDGLTGRRGRRRKVGDVARADLPPDVCTLAELYGAVPGLWDLALVVRDPAAVPEVVATARDAGPEAESRLWLTHHDVELMVSWRALSPRLHLVAGGPLKRLGRRPEEVAARLSRFGIDAVGLRHDEWTGGLVTLVHRFGLLAFATEAQFERVLDEVLDMGCDAVTSDHVDAMVAAVGRLQT